MLQISRSDRRTLSMIGVMLPAQQGAPQLWAIQPDGPLSRVRCRRARACARVKRVRVWRGSTAGACCTGGDELFMWTVGQRAMA